MLGPRSCQPYRAPPEPGTVLHTLRVISLIPLNQPLKEGFLLPILQKNRGSQKGNDSAKVTGPLEYTKHVPPSWGGEGGALVLLEKLPICFAHQKKGAACLCWSAPWAERGGPCGQRGRARDGGPL